MTITDLKQYLDLACTDLSRYMPYQQLIVQLDNEKENLAKDYLRLEFQSNALEAFVSFVDGVPIHDLNGDATQIIDDYAVAYNVGDNVIQHMKDNIERKRNKMQTIVEKLKNWDRNSAERIAELLFPNGS